MKTTNTLKIAAVCGLALASTACAWNQSRVEASYGDAVRGNMEAQLYDPATAANPSTDPVEGTDGKRMEAVVEAYRAETGSAEQVSAPLVINVGQ